MHIRQFDKALSHFRMSHFEASNRQSIYQEDVQRKQERKSIQAMNTNKIGTIRFGEPSNDLQMLPSRVICSRRSTLVEDLRQKQECKSILMMYMIEMPENKVE
jgi:hypothetical protein